MASPPYRGTLCWNSLLSWNGVISRQLQPLQVMPRAQAQLLLRTRHGRSTQRATVINRLMRSLPRDIPVAIYSESAVTLFGTEHFPEI